VRLSAWNVFAIALLCHIGCPIAFAATPPTPSIAALPLTIERNDGQADPRFYYVARHAGADVFFGANGIEFAAPREDRTARLALRFAGANVPTELLGEAPQSGRVNYLRGSSASDWIVGVPTFANVRYRQLYSGIDLVFHATEGNLEHDFLVAPGADPARIALALDGAAKLTIEPSGDLDVRFGTAHMILQKPVAWQGPETKRQLLHSMGTAMWRSMDSPPPIFPWWIHWSP
jgi:hypothetical protein